MACFSRPPRIFTSSGMRAASSTSSWSSSGTRHSSDVAMLILSVSMQQIVGQLRLGIDRQHAIQIVIACRALAKAAASGSRRQRLVPQQQLGGHIFGKHLHVGTVALLERQTRALAGTPSPAARD